MGKISSYTRALVAKLQDVFVVDQTDNNVTTTKSVTVEQIGDTVAGTQTHSTLDTSSKTLIGAINEVAKDKNVADEYDSTSTYNTGDITIYENTLYVCQDDSVTGAWDSTKWSATTVDDLIPKTDNNLPHYTGTPTAGSTAEAIANKISQVKFENTPVSISATSGYFEFSSVLNYPTANSILIGCDIRTSSLYATSGTVIQCCYATNGAKPCFQYQRGANTFSNVNYDFVFTFYEP